MKQILRKIKMKNNPIQFIIACTIFVSIGLISGFSVSSAFTTTSENHAPAQAKAEDHQPHDEQIQVKVSPQVEKSLGIQIQALETKDYTSYKNIKATITQTPLSHVSLRAPYSGFVESITVQHGEMVLAGTVAIKLIRDAIPKPELNLVSFLLSSEQKLIGMNLKDFEGLANKSADQKQVHLWKQALIRSANWSKLADEFVQILPKNLQELPFTIAVIGELSANGNITTEFVELFKKNPKATELFFEISKLSLDGQSVDHINYILSLGGLNPIIEVKIPSDAVDFDVDEILIKPGDKVSSGDRLINLLDYRQIHLEVNALGSEIALFEQVLKKDLSLFAEPIATDSGIMLENLKIRNIQSSTNGGANVHLEIINNEQIVTNGTSSKSFRTWLARPGSKYLLKVPQKVYTNVFVVGSEAVVEDGLEKMVFLKDGEAYRPANVVETFRDDNAIVLSADSDLFPGDPVVMKGAFGLNLALKAQSGGAVNPHAGHNH